MTRRHKVLLFIGCVVAVFAFQYLAMVLMFSDFHPGGDVEPNAVFTRQAELGAAMHSPFRLPLEWMQKLSVRWTGSHDFVLSPIYSRIYSAIHWVFLPLFYAFTLYFLLRLAARIFLRSATKYK
jgi:hypothetical protein